ncbi:NAD(P)H-dependent oxidoreductase [Variovorax sp. J2P1-59]|uniref:NAD(P)H-dependent oxidoreductase n=1 Tax=Variovorax flavidus TaxID=3053501 RepID=UPI002578F411|nr:NAD(P)H-dependent oxidoreductase [Variovorax sp. J2P1-59]MDM0078576.1 NAD(P)H-dependent oxidoreductase [Variovorax sp. J2P1-59]
MSHSSLVVVAHPCLVNSRVNRAWMQALRLTDATVHDLYAAYPDEKVDVRAEQRLLARHRRVILQFPLQWYSGPPLLKKWLDLVLEHGWAYGGVASALEGRQLGIAVSAWSREADYRKDGRYRRTLEELTSPFEVTAFRLGMTYLPGFFLAGVCEVDEQALEVSARDYAAHVVGSNGHGAAR